AGANVIVHYHSNRSDAERCANRIQELDSDAVTVKADLGLPTDVDRLFNHAIDEFHRFDVLIKNAGVYPVHPLGEMTVE
ncbi:MAG: SDR family NAD(P)-dependent oxidoreductase, partial [Anaerolineales bacterium]|nr:SDR family NAD(P)-dependent oxidoreductase [Anaerolineales bacterium]